MMMKKVIKLKESNKFILDILIKQKKIYLLGLICMILYSSSSYLIPITIQQVYDQIIGSSEFKKILILIISYFLINIFSIVIKNKSTYYLTIAGNKSVKEIRNKVLINLMDVSGDFCKEFKTGDLTNRILNEVEFIEQYSTNILFNLLTDLFTAIVIYIYVLFKFPLVSIIILFVLPIIYIIQSKTTSNIKELTNQSRKKFQNLANNISHISNNIFGIISLNKQSYFLNNYNIIQSEENESNLKLTKSNLNGITIQSSYLYLLQVIILIYGAYMVSNKNISVGTLISLNLYVGYIINPINKLFKNKIQIKQLQIYIDRVYELFQNAFEENNSESEKLNINSIHSIEFKNLDFSYMDNYNILQDINLTINKGEKVAIIGKSGSGKSTLTKLLYRLWDAPPRTIFINGIDINDIDKRSLRENIEYIIQESLIFNDSLINNIVFDSNYSSDKINEVVQGVCIDVFLKDFPDGINTEIYENGKNLSGGQKQRIALARACLSEAELIILDEVTSSLDNITEDQVNHYLDYKFQDKTVILITHKVNNIRDFSKIIVLNEGKIVGIGNHNGLIEACNYYRELLENETIQGFKTAEI